MKSELVLRAALASRSGAAPDLISDATADAGPPQRGRIPWMHRYSEALAVWLAATRSVPFRVRGYPGCRFTVPMRFCSSREYTLPRPNLSPTPDLWSCSSISQRHATWWQSPTRGVYSDSDGQGRGDRNSDRV